MNYPPIPPGCPYFHSISCDPVEFAFEIERGSLWPIGSLKSRKKFYVKIVSCVSRCAWLDEIERLYRDPEWLKNPLDFRTIRAKENAEAWRVWGECE